MPKLVCSAAKCNNSWISGGVVSAASEGWVQCATCSRIWCKQHSRKDLKCPASVTLEPEPGPLGRFSNWLSGATVLRCEGGRVKPCD
jgi:hypothetical protein